MKKSLYERGLSVSLLHSRLIAQSETDDWNGGGTGDETTRKTIKYVYETLADSAFYEDTDPRDIAALKRLYHMACRV